MPPSPLKKHPVQNKPTPQNHHVFDPWNSASSGHQRADNTFSGTTLWRYTRTAKLKQQFCGKEDSRNTAGSLDDEDFSAKAFDGACRSVSPGANIYGDGRASGSGSAGRTRAGEWRWIAEEEATRAQLGVRDIRCFMGVGKRKAEDEFQTRLQAAKKARNASERRIEKEKLHAIPATLITIPSSASAPKSLTTATMTSTTAKMTDIPPKSKSEPEPEQPGQNRIATPSIQPPNNPSTSKIFTGTTIYVNGSTLPQISDHKLKSLLAAHGATIAIAMARRTVSHVIIGQPGTAGQGCGGGLAAGKLQGEIERGGWKGVKVVGVDWVLESIKAGKRLAESRFAVLSIAPKGQRSVASMFCGRGEKVRLE